MNLHRAIKHQEPLTQGISHPQITWTCGNLPGKGQYLWIPCRHAISPYSWGGALGKVLGAFRGCCSDLGGGVCCVSLLWHQHCVGGCQLFSWITLPSKDRCNASHRDVEALSALALLSWGLIDCPGAFLHLKCCSSELAAKGMIRFLTLSHALHHLSWTHRVTLF